MTNENRTADPNHTLAALADAASKVLWNNPGMPRIVGVDLGEQVIGTEYFRKMAALHLAGSKTPARDMAAWANEFEEFVHYADRGRYIESWTETTVDGVLVVVWDHVKIDRIIALCDALGAKSLAELADVESRRLMDVDL